MSSASSPQQSPPERVAITLSFELSEEQRAAAEALKEQRAGRGFKRDVQTPENAPLLLTLAAQDEDEVIVVGSLAALREIHRPKGSRIEEGKHLTVDDDYKAVVLGHLESRNDRVLAAAIQAASRLAYGSSEHRDEETIGKLVALAGSERDAVRFAALDVLRLVTSWGRHPGIAEAMMAALDAEEPHIVSIVLFGMSSLDGLDRAAVKTKLEGLTAHADPGVRGRALRALSRLPGMRDTELKAEIGARAQAMLDDAHPYVRSEAATAIGVVDHFAALPRLMELLSDSERNTYTMTAWTQLDGSRGRVHHDGSAWSRVDDAVLYALSRLSPSNRNLRFRYEHPRVGDVDGGIARGVAAARAWYEQNRAALTP